MPNSVNEPRTSSRETSTPPPWWGHISLLWLMFVPLCVTLYSLLLPIGPNDFWYHARAGGVIAQTGHIPTTNLFTSNPPWVTPQTPFYYQSWISEWLLYITLEHAGLSGIAVERSLCVALAWVFLTAATYRRARFILLKHTGTSQAPEAWRTPLARTVTGGSLLAMLMACNNFDTRPQIFSVPLFALIVWCLIEWPQATPRTRSYIVTICTAIIALWVNTHGAFFTGLLLLCLLAFGEFLYSLLGRRNHNATHPMPPLIKWWGRPLPTPEMIQTALLAAFGIVAACINPHGVGIFAYVRALATNQTGQKYIQEWQAPDFSLEEWYSIVFYLSIPVVLVLLWLIARKHSAPPATAQDSPTTESNPIGPFGLRAAEMLILLALLTMALRDKRSIIWYALFLAPLWSGFWISLRLSMRGSTMMSHIVAVPRSTYYINVALALLLLSSITLFLPNTKASIDWPPAFKARFAPTPHEPFPEGFPNDPPLLLDRATPVEAVEWLKQHPARGRIWHDMVFGSYMIWALAGRHQALPMSDPRIELYPTEFWDDYVRFSAGPPDAAHTLESRGFTDALLERKLQAGLLRRLKQSPRWKEVFRRGPAVLIRLTP